MFLRSALPRLLRTRLSLHCSARFYSVENGAQSSTTAPLNILFFGSDEFSMPALDALYREHRTNPALISSLCVCHRREKTVTKKGKHLKAGTSPCA